MVYAKNTNAKIYATPAPYILKNISFNLSFHDVILWNPVQHQVKDLVKKVIYIFQKSHAEDVTIPLLNISIWTAS